MVVVKIGTTLTVCPDSEAVNRVFPVAIIGPARAEIALATIKRFEKGHRTLIPGPVRRYSRRSKRAVLNSRDDGKRLGVSIGVRKVAK